MSHDLRSLDGVEPGVMRRLLAAGAGAGPPRMTTARAGLRGHRRWINTPGAKPLTLAGLRGKVVLVDFWTYSCVNCIRTLPYLKAWYSRYHGAGLVIVGVHTPEFAFEHVVGNVRRAARARHPLSGRSGRRLQDLERLWQPVLARRLPDRPHRPRAGRALRRRRVRRDRDDIRTLLGERTSAPHAAPSGAITASDAVQSPETYLGTFRAQYSQVVHAGKPWRYTAASHPYINDLQLQGEWRVENQKIIAGNDAHLVFRYVAPRIYVVAAPPAGAAGALSPNVDGKTLASIRVAHDDLYQLAHLATAGPHTLDLTVRRGTSLYSFTFG